jgi:hypothetical protein
MRGFLHRPERNKRNLCGAALELAFISAGDFSPVSSALAARVRRINGTAPLDSRQ